jgi:formamidase
MMNTRIKHPSLALLVVLTLSVPQLVQAESVRLNVTRAGNVPVKCADERLGTCHNRWHPAIPAAAVANDGDIAIFETRDAFDNPFNFNTTPAGVAAANLNLIHPLTGPLFVKGAERGDVLAVTVVDVIPGPDRFGYTVAVPGFGFLRDVFPDPAIVRWKLIPREKDADDKNSGDDGPRWHALSDDLPGVEMPLQGFTGTIGVALGLPEIELAFAREDQLRLKGGFVLPPEPQDAVPSNLCGRGGKVADRCLRTIPPRENGGNTDIKQMITGTTLLFPCFVKGCMLSMGDTHFAQADGEVSGTAIEMNAIVTVKVEVRKGEAAFVAWPRFEGGGGVLKKLAPERFVATTGIPIKPAGVIIAEEKYLDGFLAPLTNESEDTTLAARDALLKMIDFLTGPRSPSKVKLTRTQAYLLCSVACDLHISNLVDVPNFVVSNFLNVDIFK